MTHVIVLKLIWSSEDIFKRFWLWSETLRPLAASPFFTCTLANSCQPLSGDLFYPFWSNMPNMPTTARSAVFFILWTMSASCDLNIFYLMENVAATRLLFKTFLTRAAGVGSSSLVSKVIPNKNYCQELSLLTGSSLNNLSMSFFHLRLEAPCRQPWPLWLRSVRSSPLSSLDPWRSPLGSSHLFSQVKLYT